jgi:DNA polymerase bacteriophage-type
VKLWVPGDRVPSEFIEAAKNPDFVVSAFNDTFERLIEAYIMAPRYGWPTIPIDRHRCLQASALALALPASLDKAAAALGLPQQKDRAGHLNMMTLSRPRKPRKDEDPAGVYWHDDPARLERLYAYCKQDIETERALYTRVGFLGPEEQAVWELDAAINDRGIFIDNALALGAVKIDEAAHKAIDAELKEITGGTVTSIDQTEKLGAWLAAHECEVADIQKETLRRALTRKNIPEDARRVMELRRDGAHAARTNLRP